MSLIDHTHDPAAQSWVESANLPDSDFPLQNLPYGLFRRVGHDESWRVGVAIGDQILDLCKAASAGRWDTARQVSLQYLAQGDLNRFMAQPAEQRRALRHALFAALQAGSPQQAALQACLLAQGAAEMAVPCRIGDYTDFYTGIHHATTVGKLFRPDNPLLPNYKWVPIGYHGRSSSIVVSGTSLRRPLGQLKPPHLEVPSLAPAKRLDYELELGLFVAGGNALGETIPMERADEHLFGLTLLNDWSARDVQGWEYQPLGPFLAKNFGTTVSPWIVTMEALEPFRCAFAHPPEDPQPLPYLDSAKNRAEGGYAIELEVWLQTAAMRAKDEPAVKLMRSNFGASAYWTLAQMLTHHASNGCNLQPGDLLGTGTQSGARAEEGGSLLELSLGGKQALTLPGCSTGETRTFLEDGDTVILRGYASKDGVRRIGFGDCAGTILPARV